LSEFLGEVRPLFFLTRLQFEKTKIQVEQKATEMILINISEHYYLGRPSLPKTTSLATSLKDLGSRHLQQLYVEKKKKTRSVTEKYIINQ